MRRFLGLAAAVAAVALLAAPAALADKERVRLTSRDMASARAIALRLDDLGGAGHGWIGGATAPNPPATLNCSRFDPKQSDLVLTGRAASHFALSTLQFDNQVEILRTARMVRLDWQRTVGDARLVPCLRRLFVKNLSKGETLVSFARIRFPATGEYTAVYRALVDVGTPKQRVMVDFALVGVGRTEITLVTTAPFAAAKQVTVAEQHLTQTLVVRATPGAA